MFLWRPTFWCRLTQPWERLIACSSEILFERAWHMLSKNLTVIGTPPSTTQQNHTVSTEAATFWRSTSYDNPRRTVGTYVLSFRSWIRRVSSPWSKWCLGGTPLQTSICKHYFLSKYLPKWCLLHAFMMVAGWHCTCQQQSGEPALDDDFVVIRLRLNNSWLQLSPSFTCKWRESCTVGFKVYRSRIPRGTRASLAAARWGHRIWVLTQAATQP